MTPERLPLGLLAQRNWVRDDEMFGTLPSHKKRPLEDKESVKWLDSVEALVAAREACPETTFVSVGDREADVFELFAMGRPAGVELLVRASWNRVVDSPHRYLWGNITDGQCARYDRGVRAATAGRADTPMQAVLAQLVHVQMDD